MFRKTLFVLLTFVAIPAAANATEDMLEPCINGDVSASGNYPTQELEDLTLAFLAKYLPSDEAPKPPTGEGEAVPDDDEETCWVAPEWRDAMS